jgi:hypothetical protein
VNKCLHISQRLAVVCFVPIGTTMDAEGTGPPHAMEGMTQEVTVS